MGTSDEPAPPTWRRVAALVGIAACVSLATTILWAGPPIAAPTITSSTLAPAWEKGDRVWVLRWPRLGWSPERGDVVVFPAPPSTGDRQGEGFIKRIAGLPGQTVAVRDGVLLVDGAEVDEPWRNTEHGPGPDQAPVTVPEGQLFLLGDDRGRSYDSRHWGLLEVQRVEGVAFVSLP